MVRWRKWFQLFRSPANLLVALSHYGFLGWLSDKKYLCLLSSFVFGRSFNLDNPQTFNEKLNWLKIYNRDPKYTMMADKFAVKQMIADLGIPGLHTTKCYGVWNKFEEIDIESLPSKFVLKATHDSSGATICKDKTFFDWKKVRKKFKHLLSLNNYWGGREWIYKDIPPRLIAEELLDDDSGHELTDYKFWCFNGEPKYMYVTNKGEQIYENFYDMDFNVVDISHGFLRRQPEYDKPAEFEKMKEFAVQLSKGIPFARVDFFDVKGKIYFGEFTFYDWGGLRPFEGDWDEKLGKMLQLPNV